MDEIPLISVQSLFGPSSDRRTEADAAIRDGAAHHGFLVLTDLPESIPVDPDSRQRLLEIFSLPDSAKRQISRKAAVPENPNIYRGYFPLSSGVIKEGIDIGPELPSQGVTGDALIEATPLPKEAVLPGWRALTRKLFGELEHLGSQLMRALARGLALPEDTFDDAFRGGISTLRLLHYPAWPDLARRYEIPLKPLAQGKYAIGGSHVDSGFLTLLQQDQVEGLQIKSPQGQWLDIPHREGSLILNFGQLLERWTGGRVRATTHRVLGNEISRYSIPFFYEPRVNACIQPLLLEGVEPFEPFLYGDHLWEAISAFSEFQNAVRFQNGLVQREP